jgi:hypothetical protein
MARSEKRQPPVAPGARVATGDLASSDVATPRGSAKRSPRLHFTFLPRDDPEEAARRLREMVREAEGGGDR